MLLAPFIGRIRKRVWVWILVVIGALLGVLPDLIAVYGFLVEGDHGVLFASAHHGPIRDVLQIIPMCTLHFAIDSLTHDHDRQWYGWNVRIWLEVILWVVNIAVIVWFVRIWRSNTALERNAQEARRLVRNAE